MIMKIEINKYFSDMEFAPLLTIAYTSLYIGVGLSHPFIFPYLIQLL